ncbi:MAG: hypothetical protein SFU25_06365 [Candidatus Caenarcaniphilales bacterium]|nr:hypothetical protein [Candidatus Caenarcaniphilales bacterium]
MLEKTDINVNYPQIYAEVAFGGQSVTTEHIQAAWNKVHPNWKQIFLNMQRTQEALKSLKS